MLWSTSASLAVSRRACFAEHARINVNLGFLFGVLVSVSGLLGDLGERKSRDVLRGY